MNTMLEPQRGGRLNGADAAGQSSATDGGTDAALHSACHRIHTLLQQRDRLHARTTRDVDFLRAEPKIWSEYEAQLGAALVELRNWHAISREGLLAKLNCHHALLATFGIEDGRVMELGAALIEEVRAFLSRADDDGGDMLRRMVTTQRPGSGNPIFRMFARPEALLGWAGRRSHD